MAANKQGQQGQQQDQQGRKEVNPSTQKDYPGSGTREQRDNEADRRDRLQQP